MGIQKIAFSINGDPTRGYKNVAFRGLLNYTGQAYLSPKTILTDGGDTYICYITDKSYELHIVTSSSRVGGLESRGAFNVGVSIPKGSEIKDTVGNAITLSRFARALREKFASIAMTPNNSGRYQYDAGSLDTPMLNESLAQWIDSNYHLEATNRKEIVMKGTPDKESRLSLRLPSIEKIDEFFSDPHFSKLVQYGSVETVCSTLPNTVKLDIPRKKQYDLKLIYRKGNETMCQKSFPAFFKSGTVTETLPIGNGVAIEKYEDFKPIYGSTASLEQLKRNNYTNVSIDNVSETVTMTIDIIPRTYILPIQWKAEERDGNPWELSLSEIKRLSQEIVFKIDRQVKYLKYDERDDRYYLELKGTESTRKWVPEMQDEDDQWELYKHNIGQNKIILLLRRLKNTATVKLSFYTAVAALSNTAVKDIIKNLRIESTSYSNDGIEKPVIDTQSVTITFNKQNIAREWRYVASTSKYKVDSKVQLRDADIKKGVLDLKATKIQPIATGSATGETGINPALKKSEYTVILRVISKKLLPVDSFVTLKLSSSGKSEKIPLKLEDNQSGSYLYIGSKSIDPSFSEADDVFLNGRSVRFTTDDGWPVETITIRTGINVSKYVKKGIPILILFVLGFLMGSLVQRYCDVPFTAQKNDVTTVPEEALKQRSEDDSNLYEKTIDSLQNEIHELNKKIASISPESTAQKTTVNEQIKPDNGKRSVTKTQNIEIRKKILLGLKKIDINQGNKAKADKAREIVNQYINDTSIDDVTKNWCQISILIDDDSAVAAVVNNIIRDKKDYFEKK